MPITGPQLDAAFEYIDEVSNLVEESLTWLRTPPPLETLVAGSDNEARGILLSANYVQEWVDEEEAHDASRGEELALSVARASAMPKLRRLVEAIQRVRAIDAYNLADDLETLTEIMRGEMFADFDWGKQADGLLQIAESLRGESELAAPNQIVPPTFEEFNHDLMRLLSENPELMFTIQPYIFERVVATIFERFHMQVEVTQRTRDGGYDVVAIEETKYTKNKYLIEVKRYERDKKVGLGVVQRLYGVKTDRAATKAFLVTSSSFSRPAVEFARKHSWELELKDYSDLSAWLKLHWPSK